MTNKINVISNPNSYIPMTMTFNSCSIRLHLQLFVGGLLFVLRYLCLLASNTYRAVFLFCYSSSCVPYVTSFFRLFICNSSFGFLWRLLTKKVYPKNNHVTSGIITLLVKMFVLKEPYFLFHSTWCICVTIHIRYNNKVSTFLEYLERKRIIFPELFSKQMDIKPN